MKLGIITLLSLMRDDITLEDTNYEFVAAMKKEFDVVFIDPEEVDTVDFTIVFVGSGGTESYLKSIYSILPKPVMLLTGGLQNSLPASMEMLTWIREMGDESIIIHGSVDETIEQIKYYYRVHIVRKKLRETNIGVIGYPSDWLIASGVNYIESQRRWGVNYNSIEFNELGSFIEEVNQGKANKIARDFIKNAYDMKEASEKDVVEAARIYLALKAMCEEYKLNAITLRCFEIISQHNTTACLALSLLNSEGIICACEGDMQSAFSMVLLNILTDKKSFLTNPSRIDISKNEIILAHCTIPLCMTSKYTIRNHFESLMGVGIQGEMKNGPVTVFKCGGSNLDRYFVSSGQMLENLNDENLCRTQIKLHLDGNVEYFLRNPIANHHMVIEGDYAKLIDDFMRSMNCRKII